MGKSENISQPVTETNLSACHPSSDDSPLPYARLWSDADIASHALSTEAIHRHGSLAAVELWHSGHSFARGLVEPDTLYLCDEPVVPAAPVRVFPHR